MTALISSKILLVGASGLLGCEFRNLLPPHSYHAPSSQEMDITDIVSVEAYGLARNDISLIINCAACRDAEFLEEHAGMAQALNVTGPQNLAVLANKLGVPLIHFSTDYVFNGRKTTPYIESDTTEGLSVYGTTKLQGEQAVLETAETCLCIRTAWLFSLYGRDFIKTIIVQAQKKRDIGVVFDQTGSPAYAGDVARAVLDILPEITKGAREIYHLTNEGIASWYDLAYYATRHALIDCHIRPIHSDEYPLRAARPAYSVLDKTKIKRDFGITLRHWSEGVADCIARIRAETDLLNQPYCRAEQAQ